MKPFDLNAAKNGAPVMTRDGRDARIICYDADGDYPVIALVKYKNRDSECPFSYTKSGNNEKDGPTDRDLVMKFTKWEPEGGDWYVLCDGSVEAGESTSYTRDYGAERKSKELAERAAAKMRQFNRLLAYVDEACGGYEFKANHPNYFLYRDNNQIWQYGVHSMIAVYLGLVYMPKSVAIDLVKKLRNGEVEL